MSHVEATQEVQEPLASTGRGCGDGVRCKSGSEVAIRQRK
jgi:hypothetical protein